MSNFDLKKFLAEGKLYEEAASTEEAMKSSTKMTKSDLKKKIRQEILAELTLSEDDEISVDNDLSKTAEDLYSPVAEATKDGDGEVPAKDEDTDLDIEDTEEVDVDVETKPKAAGPAGDFLDQLETLKNEADAMGDNKLERQIDNTITYFTRQHIAKDTNESIELEEADRDYYDAAERDDAAHIAALERDMEDDKRSAMRNESLKTKTTKTTMKESLEILRMKKLAGLLTEGEYAKALLKEEAENIADFLNTNIEEFKEKVANPRSKFEIIGDEKVATAGPDDESGIDVSFDKAHMLELFPAGDPFNEVEETEIAGRKIYYNNYL